MRQDDKETCLQTHVPHKKTVAWRIHISASHVQTHVPRKQTLKLHHAEVIALNVRMVTSGSVEARSHEPQRKQTSLTGQPQKSASDFFLLSEIPLQDTVACQSTNRPQNNTISYLAYPRELSLHPFRLCRHTQSHHHSSVMHGNILSYMPLEVVRSAKRQPRPTVRSSDRDSFSDRLRLRTVLRIGFNREELAPLIGSD